MIMVYELHSNIPHIELISMLKPHRSTNRDTYSA